MRFLISFCGNRTIIALVLLSSGIVALEVFSIALIFPFLALYSSPQKIETVKLTHAVYTILGFSSHRDFLFFTGGCIVLLYVVKFFGKYALVTTRNWTLNAVTLRLSTVLFKNLLGAEYALFTKRSGSEMVGVVNAHTVHSMICLDSWVNIISELVFLVVVIIGLLVIDYRIALGLICGFGAIGGLLYYVLVKRLSKRGETHSNLNRQVYRFAYSVSSAIKDIKIMRLEENFYNNFFSMWDRYARNDSASKSLKSIPKDFAEMVVFCAIILFCLYLLIIGRNIQEMLPTLGVIAMGSFKLLPSFNKIVSSYNEHRFYRSSLGVVRDLYKELRCREQKIEHVEMPFTSVIEVKNLRFSYGDKLVLDNVSFAIGKGSSCAIVGASGVGKSTILDILIGLRKPQGGVFLLDDTSFNPYATDVIRSRIGYVPQNVAVIDDSIAFNISFERDFDRTKMQRTIDMAQLGEFVRELPEGLDTSVGESGVRLSGGQRQRIGIARALYRDPEIIVFDEATSSLDTITERELMEQIYGLCGSKTIIIVAHRLSTIERCKKIFVLDQGRFVGCGEHQALLKSCPLYGNLYRHQGEKSAFVE